MVWYLKTQSVLPWRPFNQVTYNLSITLYALGPVIFPGQLLIDIDIDIVHLFAERS
ncbi:hypothetical protein HGRIS_012002 [Hohenbuehelia grisea]|uniref:Uncharacterized protein n=1 Tax=Hohenbuehelia grisea TaxID=104357 RepID=A0ABR3JWS2_9AGAR